MKRRSFEILTQYILDILEPTSEFKLLASMTAESKDEVKEFQQVKHICESFSQDLIQGQGLQETDII